MIRWPKLVYDASFVLLTGAGAIACEGVIGKADAFLCGALATFLFTDWLRRKYIKGSKT